MGIFRQKGKGFSLIEVLIFVAVLALFFVTATSVVTATLRNMKINEHKILATRYAEELLEWIRGQKEIDWNSFANSYTSPIGKTYCFPDLSWNNNCSLYLATIFTRKAILTSDGNIPPNQIDISISVTWLEPGGSFSLPIKTVFRIWE